MLAAWKIFNNLSINVKFHFVSKPVTRSRFARDQVPVLEEKSGTSREINQGGHSN